MGDKWPKISKSYVNYCLIVLVIMLDAMLLALIGNNTIWASFYVVINFLLIGIFCLRNSATNTVIVSILFMLFYSLFIDICIHYLHIEVILELEFIYLFPLFLACLKTEAKTKPFFESICLVYVLLNLGICLFAQKVDLYNSLLTLVNVMTFIAFFYLFKNLQMSSRFRDLYSFLFICSTIMTIGQTVAGFHTDTRNGVFSVFGFGAYTFFIMLFIVYKISMFTFKRISLMHFVLCVILCGGLFILIEAKAALVVMFANIVLISAIQREISGRKLLIVCLGIAAVPLAYGIMLKFNPKFHYLNNVNSIISYYVGNNNWRYQYGRFEAIKNVFSERGLIAKLFGVGFGSSTPMYNVFFNELKRKIVYPYYINKYGFNYGFQHTSTATLLLDGGLVLMGGVVAAIVTKLIKVLRTIAAHRNNVVGAIQLGILVYLLYYFTYANLLKDFRAMAITAIILAINPNSRFLNISSREKIKNGHRI